MTGPSSRRRADCRPLGIVAPPDPATLVRLEGCAKEALETGRTRLLAAALLFGVAFLVIGLRLVGLGLFPASAEPRVAKTPQASQYATVRADIVDRNGVVLATTLPSASLYANPRQIRDPEAAARRLVAVLPDLDYGALSDRLSADRAFVWLKRRLTPREQYAVNSLGIPGLYFQNELDRVYPHGALTGQIVGFANVDNKGLAGIEQSFESRLRGSTKPLALSVDLRVQHILAEELEAAMTEFQALGAAGIVLDARTGEVVAMVSLPTFDPREPAAAEEESRFNRASLGVYELGSVFKIFTTAQALDQGAVELGDGYDVSKPIRVARFTIRDFKPKNRWLSVPEIFVYSSNIGTVHMAMETGTAAQKVFLDSLGLTRRAAIELPEVGEPMLPAPWREINTMTISYGHGMAVSPVQLASAVAAVVNGGELKPATLIKRPEGATVPGKRVIGAETSRDMRWLMRLVVQHGTGRNADASGYLVGGKTGTADKLKDGRRYARDARIASFVGAFPMDAPRYVVFAMVDEPKGLKRTYGYATGGWVAAPVVRRVVERMAPLMGLSPRLRDEEEGAERFLVPASFRGKAFASR